MEQDNARNQALVKRETWSTEGRGQSTIEQAIIASCKVRAIVEYFDKMNKLMAREERKHGRDSRWSE